MHRITITLDDALVEEIDRRIAAGAGENRSEAVRDLLRAGLAALGEENDPAGECVGVLTYAYEHRARELAKRLTERHHADHDLSLCSTHLHLDHESCLEVAILRGEAASVRRMADGVISERGVRHGGLTMVPVETHEQAHDHGGRTHRHTHVKIRETS